MTSTLETFFTLTHACGAAVHQLEIPSDVKGDDEAELKYAQHELEGLVMNVKDARDAAIYILANTEGGELLPTLESLRDRFIDVNGDDKQSKALQKIMDAIDALS